MLKRHILLGGLLVLAGCASVERVIMPEPPAPDSHYHAEPGRDSASIEHLRAASAPEAPSVSSGSNRSADHRRMIARGFVLVGTGEVSGPEAAARDAATQQARRVGADLAYIYAPPADASDALWTTTYYVRLQLPFGATFRDLKSAERDRVGGVGGVAIGTVIGATPASRANLRAGDFILKVDGNAIVGRAGFQQMLAARAGRAVTLTIVRNGETLERVVKLGEVAAGSTP